MSEQAPGDEATFARIKSLFRQANELPREQWSTFVQAAAPGEATLQAEVLELLANSTNDDESLRARVQAAAQRELTAAEDHNHPEHIGPYFLTRVLGRGGMGTVYEAEQTEPVRRRVAVKVINLEMQTDELVLRFERERQALALMHHDGIAKVHECGTTDRGQPYLVMELVSGTPLTDYCNDKRLPLQKRIRLIRQLCSAMQHAHQKGVVHRDLKPSNVLVSDTGGKLQVKVIDFGLAKSVWRTITDQFHTHHDSWGGGTPTYMAPEQTGSSDDIDTRADIYSIGVMLYEVLVDTLPIPYDELMRDGERGMFRHLLETVPPRPSARLASDAARATAIAAARRTSVATLAKALRSDLDWIVRRALEKDREDRYASAAALAEDLKRFLDNEPVQAGPPSTGYRLRKFAQRYRSRIVTAALLLLMAMAAGVTSTVLAVAYANKVAEFQEATGVLRLRKIWRDLPRARRETPGSEPAMLRWLQTSDDLLAERPQFKRALQNLSTQARDAQAAELQFDDAVTEFLHEELISLLTGLDELAEARNRMQHRLDWLRAVQRPEHQPNSRVTWQQARAAIRRNPHYRDLDLTLPDEQVVGLTPIGENPHTGLWEFYHLRSTSDEANAGPGAIRVPDMPTDGNIRIGPRTGIVFVLLPGGRTAYGAASDDARHEDRDAHPNEGPVQTAMLQPFFIARHETTRGQWQRLGGATNYQHTEAGDHVDASYPAENLSWDEAHQIAWRHGLDLPSEAQWEYACRATSTTPWASGTSAAASYQLGVMRRGDRQEILCRVGSLRPNRFGLFDMHGNLLEWCLDVSRFYGDYDAIGPGNHLQIANDPVDDFIVRGGSFAMRPIDARSSRRIGQQRSNRSAQIGVRFVRALMP